MGWMQMFFTTILRKPPRGSSFKSDPLMRGDKGVHRNWLFQLAKDDNELRFYFTTLVFSFAKYLWVETLIAAMQTGLFAIP